MNQNHATCEVCEKPHIFFWTEKQKIYCDKCWWRDPRIKNLSRDKRLFEDEHVVFNPLKLDDGTYVTSPEVTFDDIRFYIEQCIEANRSNQKDEKLIDSYDGIHALIKLLASKVSDPFSDPAYLELLKSEQITKADLRKGGEQDREDFWDVYDKLERIRKQMADFIANHPSTPKLKIIDELAQRHRETGKVTHLYQDNLPLQRPCPPSTPLKKESKHTKPSIAIEKVDWVYLDPDEFAREQLIGLYTELGGEFNEGYDLRRLDFVLTFKPDKIALGKNKWKGYVVFCFESRQRVVLECPKLGNATYCLELNDWHVLKKKSKSALLLNLKAKRIIHSSHDTWRNKLKIWIESGGTPPFNKF
jgi:hypothetical protein